MQIDFVKVPYTTGPNMVRNPGPIFISPPSQDIIRQKKIELQKYDRDLWGQKPQLENVVEKAAKFCDIFSNNIQDMALRLEEDVAIMHKGRLAAICFCFPSGFIPSQRLGLLLEEIHKPVADNQLLIKASSGITRVMCEQPSFKRHVWTITVNPDLSNHPNNKKNLIAKDIDDLYFRWETQTTARIDDDTSIFFVKVDVVPLRKVWNQKILESINSMSKAVLDYKNLHEIKSLLNKEMYSSL